MSSSHSFVQGLEGFVYCWLDSSLRHSFEGEMLGAGGVIFSIILNKLAIIPH
jgi:hypothetical protein